MSTDTPRLIKNTAHAAAHPWPADVYLQGGDRGVVFAGEDTYRTAFVEAFPAGTFLRGEGATVPDAETDAWRQYRRYLDCDGTRPGEAAHGPYERRQYRNGAGFCTRCGVWMNRVFEPLPPDPDRGRSLIERVVVDKDPEALRQVVEAMAHVDELPPRSETPTPPEPDKEDTDQT